MEKKPQLRQTSGGAHLDYVVAGAHETPERRREARGVRAGEEGRREEGRDGDGERTLKIGC